MKGIKVVKSMALMALWRFISKIEGFWDAIKRNVNGDIWRVSIETPLNAIEVKRQWHFGKPCKIRRHAIHAIEITEGGRKWQHKRI